VGDLTGAAGPVHRLGEMIPSLTDRQLVGLAPTDTDRAPTASVSQTVVCHGHWVGVGKVGTWLW
jgi:hypothetical protein